MKRFLSFVGFLAVFPFFLSRRSRVVRTTWIHAEPAAVFPFINRLKSWPLWAEWSCTERMEARYEGPEEGEGAVQHWATRCSEGTLRIIASAPDQHLSYSLEMDGGRLNLEGVLTLEPVGNGTRLTWACWWVGGENPYARYLDLAMRWGIGRDFQTGLENLKTLAETAQTQAQPEAV